MRRNILAPAKVNEIAFKEDRVSKPKDVTSAAVTSDISKAENLLKKDHFTPAGGPPQNTVTANDHYTEAQIITKENPLIQEDNSPHPIFFGLNMTETNWNLSVRQWEYYISQHGTLDNDNMVQMLKFTCSEELQRRIFWVHFHTTHDLLKPIKELAVHRIINFERCENFERNSNEDIRAFSNRVRASLCKCVSCETQNNYQNYIVWQIIIRGIKEYKIWQKVQREIAPTNLSGNLKTLDELVTFIEEEEAIAMNQQNIENVGIIQLFPYQTELCHLDYVNVNVTPSNERESSNSRSILPELKCNICEERLKKSSVPGPKCNVCDERLKDNEVNKT